SLAFIRKASRPPRRSTVLSALVEIRSLTERPSASDIMVTLTRLARNRRLVLMLEWLTLWPTCAALPVNSQRRDMLEILESFSSLAPRAGRMKPSPVEWDRGRIETVARRVKFAARPGNRARPARSFAADDPGADGVADGYRAVTSVLASAARRAVSSRRPIGQ